MTHIETMKQALHALELIDAAMPFPVAKLAMQNLRFAIKQASESMTDKQLDQNTVEFRLKDPSKEVLRLDKDGFHYKGQTIDDAGEAYRLFMDWMSKTNMEIDNELP